MNFSKNVNNNKDAPKLIFFNEKKKFRKIRIIFDIENWLWKSEIRIFQSPPAKRTLICHFFFLWKSAIFHSIKLPFDAEVAEKFLNGIYSTGTYKQNHAMCMKNGPRQILKIRNIKPPYPTKDHFLGTQVIFSQSRYIFTKWLKRVGTEMGWLQSV